MDFPSLLAAADRAALGHLGGSIRYVSGTGTESDVVGIFDNAAENAVVQGQEVTSSGPRAFMLLADLPTDPVEELAGYPRLIIGTATYLTRDIRKDGQGGVVLLLNEAP